ncbi:hypothetical protein [Streptomyces sp. NPDC059575]|uniref:hypothetical protein n=1 Tax=Streptomyces sp. NPDC059575 TaxID=3346872 RepID=UPI003687724E
MILDDLDFAGWRSLDVSTVRRLAEEVAGRVGGSVSEVGAGEHLGGVWHRVLIERGGQEFALIPGGRVTVGFDLDAWRPTPEQEADYAASVDAGFGYGPDLRAHLAQVLSPRRTVTVPTVLMAVEAEALTELPADTPDELAARGLRMPSADEWEHACGAGAGTLFRWGDACPFDRIPYGDRSGPQNDLNAFGLRIAHDTYSAELSQDSGAVHGGDGGESACGGYGTFLGWLPLATANRNPSMAELVYGEEGEDMWEDFSTRPVLPF